MSIGGSKRIGQEIVCTQSDMSRILSVALFITWPLELCLPRQHMQLDRFVFITFLLDRYWIGSKKIILLDLIVSSVFIFSVCLSVCLYVCQGPADQTFWPKNLVFCMNELIFIFFWENFDFSKRWLFETFLKFWFLLNIFCKGYRNLKDEKRSLLIDCFFRFLLFSKLFAFRRIMQNGSKKGFFSSFYVLKKQEW